MSRLSAILVATWLSSVIAGNLIPARASAQVEVTLRVVGITVIGAIDDRMWAGTLSLRGCTWRSLGDAPLSEDYVIRGTRSSDTISVLDAPAFWCNRLLSPVNQNGHAIQIYGGDGNDILYGGGSAPFSGNPNSIFGEDGDDTLYLGPGGAHAEGGSGDDYLIGGDSAGDVLLGGTGDDVLCEHSAVEALTLDGGDGDDRSCSDSATSGFNSIEQVSCLLCGLGY